MAIGTLVRLRVSENDAGTVVLRDAEFVDYSYTGTAPVAGVVSFVKKEDFTGTANDTFVVGILYPEATPIASSTTLANLTTMARAAVNAALGAGEAGAST